MEALRKILPLKKAQLGAALILAGLVALFVFAERPQQQTGWEKVDIRAPGVDLFGRDIVKTGRYALHKVAADPPGFLPAVVKVTDGDTFVLVLQIHGVEGAKGTWDEICRIADINTPEKGQPFAQEARKRLLGLIFGNPVKVVPTGKRGRYGRVLVDVFDAKGRNVGLLLIREGLARVYKTSKRQEFLDAQRIAREKKVGIWAIP